jgi:site-specific DNA-methyltransferase (adenine-specific)
MLTIDELGGDWTKALNNVVQADCLEVMRLIPDNAIPLVLCDPPYGIGIESSGTYFKRFTKKGWDDCTPEENFFNELRRISKHQIIWGGNYFIDHLPSTRCLLVWDKMVGNGMSFADAEIAWTSFDMPVRIKKALSRFKNKQHPTQKPVELMVWCLENYLMKNWKEDRRPIVFDGFSGSGTTGVACKKCGCDYILVEKDPDYVKICEKRLSQETLF